MIKIFKQRKHTQSTLQWLSGELSHQNVLIIADKLKVVFPYVEYNKSSAKFTFSDETIEIQPLTLEQEERILKFFKHLFFDILKTDMFYTDFSFTQPKLLHNEHQG